MALTVWLVDKSALARLSASPDAQAWADRGMHRAPSIRVLLIAAVAERSGLTMLHNDKDFDLIAGITGQAVETLRLP